MLPRHLIEWALLSAPDAIVICDARGRIEFVSRQVSALFGYEAEELLGLPIEQLLPQRLRGSHRDLRARFAHAPRARAMGEGLELQERAIGAMARLLNALLDISKLEAGGDLLRSDLSLLEQVMRNLVANAIKYTPRGEVRVRCLREPALVWLEVADTGVGIAPDQLPHIFDEFFQVGARSSGTGNGYGLGLSIVRRIVELLELKLEVRSEPGAGSSFRVGVPVGAGS